MAKTTDATLITNANKGLSLDVAERQRRYLIPIGANDTAGDVHDAPARLGAELLPETLPAVPPATPTPPPHHHAPATVGSDDGQARLAITGGEVVAGSVEETDAADGESR